MIKVSYADYHLRMHYHLIRVPARDPDWDILRPELIFSKFYAKRRSDADLDTVRDFVKQATDICLSAESRPAATKSVEKLLANDEPVSDIVEGIERITGVGIVRRIERAHYGIRRHFFRPDGTLADLVRFKDVMIMLDIESDFADAWKPVKTLHGAILCKRSDVRFAKKVMMRVYKDFLGFYPIVLVDHRC